MKWSEWKLRKGHRSKKWSDFTKKECKWVNIGVWGTGCVTLGVKFTTVSGGNVTDM